MTSLLIATRRFFYLPLCAIALCACTVKLDVNPSADIPQDGAIATPLAIENALTSVYALMADSNLYGGSFYIWPTILSDAAAQRYPGDEGDVYNFRATPSDVRVNRAWQAAYQAINRCNLILERCASTDSADKDYRLNRDRFRGEALCLRSILYFDLVRLFTPQACPGQATGGILLRTTPAKDREQAPAVSADVVLAQVEADLKEATTLLGIQDSSTRNAPLGSGVNITAHVTAGTAYGYLACLYFQQMSLRANAPCGDETATMGKALAAIEAAIGPSVLVTYADLGASSAFGYPSARPLTTIIENLFGQKGTSLPTNGEHQYSEALFQILSSKQIPMRRSSYLSAKYSNVPGRGFGNPQYVLSDTILAKQEGSSLPLLFLPRSDIRQMRFYYTTSPRTVEKFDQSTAINYPVLRSAQLLLSRAEILAARNQGQDLAYAVADLAIVKKRAQILTNRNSTGLGTFFNSLPALNGLAERGAGNLASRDSLLAEIRRERIRELLFEPDRLYDLKRRRLQIAPVGSRPATDAAALHLPIPEIETNNNLAL